ncbi:AMP-binding protein [Bacillus sp. z60-18]|uniref:AMP-binding protein n=1 Tax=unclassified Bacillus (in: firmicutes) TaxID=185979 RepID=UPI00390C7EAE
MPITETYQRHAQQHPEKTAIQTGTESIQYKDWHRLVCRTAAWLNSQKRTNKRIAFMLPNGLPFLQLFAGAAAAGWTAVPFDPRWSRAECIERLLLCKPDLFITERPFPEYEDALALEECLADIRKRPVADEPDIDDEEPFYIGFTSGSTGAPKAFIRSQRSWIESFRISSRDFQLSAEDRAVIPGPLFFSHFLYGAMNTLFLGGTVDLLHKFSTHRLEKTIDSLPVTALYTVPTMTEAMSSENRRIERPLKIISSGANWSQHAKNAFQKAYPNLLLYDFYGTSELSFVSVSAPRDFQVKPASVGRPFQNVDVSIRRNSGDIADTGEVGKIYVKSPMVFSGYLQEQAGFPRPDESGWMTVGDMGWMDDDGYLYISGRENSMIVYGGINIFPEEIEAVLTSHPEVEEAAVVGIADDYWGEKAAAVIKGGASVKELKALCRRRLAPYKIPRSWHVVEELPHTAGGKIARSLVRKQLKELIK